MQDSLVGFELKFSFALTDIKSVQVSGRNLNGFFFLFK